MTLDAMRAYDQWINHTPDKLPVSPHTGQVCDAQDPTAWASYDVAKATGRGLGFVFTPKDPFWFLDIDGCRQGGTWSPLALSLCDTLKGAAFEKSFSGDGLHGYGTQPEKLSHSCRRPDLGIEFYTEGRFAIVTEVGLIGDSGFVPDLEIYRGVVGNYFPITASQVVAGAPTGWTTEPSADWLGPDDDAELVARMLRSRSAKSIVGTGITAKDLWNADDDKLAATYPDVAGSQGRAWDWSQADAALCSHLAFWTGRNCERMERLWGQSVLGNRDKYRDRADYRHDTILGAVKICPRVYRDRTLIPVADPTAAPGADGIRDGYQFLTPQDQQGLFKGCVYVRDAHKVFVPDGDLLKPEQFKAVYGGRVFALDSVNDKTTRNAWDAFVESQALETPTAHSTCFRPECPPGGVISEEGWRYVNTYVPINTEAADGDPGPFLDLIGKMLPDPADQAVLLAYMAACVQYPGVKFQWAPVIQGTFGNGKSFLTKILTFCVGSRYTHKVNAQDIDNKFNAWLYGKLLIIIDEIKTGGRSSGAAETLKWLISDDRVPMQGKGKDQTTGDNRANIIMCTNHKDGAVKTRDDRRLAIFFTAQQCKDDLHKCGMTGSYFPALAKWLGGTGGTRGDGTTGTAGGGGYAIINGYLRGYAIPAELNPADQCVWAPVTSSVGEAVAESFGAAGQDVIEATQDGTPGFRGGWVSTMALGRLLSDIRPKLSVNQRGALLTEMGYIKHPGLPDGRVTKAILAEGGKPRLYVKEGHLSINLVDPSAIADAYCVAQDWPTGAGVSVSTLPVRVT